MDILPGAYPAIGAITAALIAGAISFVSAVLSKDQKTSEFRQAWIDSLRDEVSEFLSHVSTITSMLRSKHSRGSSVEELLKYVEESDEGMRQASLMYARIRLRLNPKENAALLEKLDAVRDLLRSAKAFDKDYAGQAYKDLINEAQQVLKVEWKRVKRGEWAFVATKYISLLLFLVSVAVAAYHGKPYILSAMAL
ncbi:MAG: hypothetical protein LLG15_10775 [Betaproteobacteria bacterium]|nr:hypothetical protein [Betaproteobacteria bacterium]